MILNPSDLPKERFARSRYLGTRPFTDSDDDRARFFGRPDETEELYLRVLSVLLLVQFGKSGLGKTSLLQAGLFPLLRQKPFLPVMVRLNVAGETLTLAVARSMQEACKTEGLEFTEARTDGLWELLSTISVWRDDLLLTPVLVFDQFEEVFTLRDATFRADLAIELGALVSGIAPDHLQPGRSGARSKVSARPEVKIVISLREDYLGALEEFSAAIPGLFHERLRLESLTETGARNAITKPARLTTKPGEDPYWTPAFEYESKALDKMITFLKGNSGVIEPFPLQLLCRHAEKIAHDKGQSGNSAVTLTLSDFEGDRDFTSVLNNFYRETLLKIPGSQRKRAEALCEEGLLNGSGHRRMREEGEIRKEFRIEKGTLNTLSEERLVRREPRHESLYYEISHDRLAESIFGARRFRLTKNVKLGLWAASVAALILIGGLIVWNQTVQSERNRAESERNRAKSEREVAELERNRAEQALSQAGLERDRAESERKNAESARKNAEELLTFLLGEKFLGEVRDAGRGIMLELVHKEVERRAGGSNQRGVLISGLALRNEGDLKRMQGSITDAVARFRQGLSVMESSTQNPASKREIARTRDRLGEALVDQGKVSQGISQYEAAVREWRQVVRNDSKAATDDCTSLADSLITAAYLKNNMGNMNHALAGVEEALKISAAVLFGRQTSREACGGVNSKIEPYPDAKAVEVFSRAVLVRALMLSFTEDYEGAAALATAASELRPHSVSAKRYAATALGIRGSAKTEANQSVLDDQQKVVAHFQELRRWDSNNRLWQRELAATKLLLSEATVACYKSKSEGCTLEAAEATTLEAIATLRALAQIDPPNVSWQRDLGWALRGHAAALGAGERRQSERLALLEEAENLFTSSKTDSADAEGDVILTRVLVDKSQALEALEQLPKAKETLRRASNLFVRLIAAHPDNASFVIYLYTVREMEAEMLKKAGDETGAIAAVREKEQLLETYKSLTRRYEKQAEKLVVIRNEHVEKGNKLLRGGNYTAALDEFNNAELVARNYIVLKPTAFSGYEWLHSIYYGIQSTEEKLNHANERTAALVKAMHAAWFAALLAPLDSAQKMQTQLKQARQQLGIYLNDNKKFDEALGIVQTEVDLAESMLRGEPQNASYLQSLGNAQCGLGVVRRAGGKEAGWEEAIRICVIQIEKAAKISKTNAAHWKELGSWRRYLGNELTKESRKKRVIDEVLREKALVEYRLALKAYQEAASVTPDDKEVQQEIRELSKLEVVKGGAPFPAP